MYRYVVACVPCVVVALIACSDDSSSSNGGGGTAVVCETDPVSRRRCDCSAKVGATAVECSLPKSPTRVCCASSPWPNTSAGGGRCSCDQVTCTASLDSSASAVTSCQCYVGLGKGLGVGTDVPECKPTAPGECCQNDSARTCTCGRGACASGERAVPMCSPASFSCSSGSVLVDDCLTASVPAK